MSKSGQWTSFSPFPDYKRLLSTPAWYLARHCSKKKKCNTFIFPIPVRIAKHFFKAPLWRIWMFQRCQHFLFLWTKNPTWINFIALCSLFLLSLWCLTWSSEVTKRAMGLFKLRKFDTNVNNSILGSEKNSYTGGAGLCPGEQGPSF